MSNAWNGVNGYAVSPSEFPEEHVLELYHPKGVPGFIWATYPVKISMETQGSYRLNMGPPGWNQLIRRTLKDMEFEVDPNDKNKLFSKGQGGVPLQGYSVTSWVITRTNDVDIDNNPITVFEDDIEWQSADGLENVETSWRWVPADSNPPKPKTPR